MADTAALTIAVQILSSILKDLNEDDYKKAGNEMLKNYAYTSKGNPGAAERLKTVADLLDLKDPNA